MAAVEKIEDQRKPEDFFGYRNRIAPYGGYRSAANRPINIYLTLVPRAHTWVRPYGVVRNCNSTINIYLTVV